MRSFILLTFLFLGIGFYELSGGGDFVPESRPGVAEAEPVAPALPDIVTRDDPDSLAGLDALPGVPERLAQPLIAPEVAAAEQAVAAAVAAAIAGPVAAPEAEPVLVSLATPTAAADPAVERYVVATALNVRAGPSTSDRVLTRLSQNAAVTVLADVGDGWSLVRVGSDGTEGWVASEFLGP